jgi:L-asparaginase/Glu-tRNA(Gln) amidotransferase subunit D
VTAADREVALAGSVLVLALGGTIAMTNGGGAGAVPTLDADDLLAGLPATDGVGLCPRCFRRLPGAHLTLEDGIVLLEALGGGHVPAAMLGTIDVAAAAVPVVLASRTQAGEVLPASYGFPGSERDLRERGELSAGSLNARKARILLGLTLGEGARGAQVAARLDAYRQTAGGRR